MSVLASLERGTIQPSLLSRGASREARGVCLLLLIIATSTGCPVLDAAPHHRAHPSPGLVTANPLRCPGSSTSTARHAVTARLRPRSSTGHTTSLRPPESDDRPNSETGRPRDRKRLPVRDLTDPATPAPSDPLLASPGPGVYRGNPIAVPEGCHARWRPRCHAPDDPVTDHDLPRGQAVQ